MTRKSLVVLTVVCLAVGLSAGFAGSAGAAHVPADDGGTSNQFCQDDTQPDCIGGGAPPEPTLPPSPPTQPPAETGGGSGGIGGGNGGCAGGAISACDDM